MPPRVSELSYNLRNYRFHDTRESLLALSFCTRSNYVRKHHKEVATVWSFVLRVPILQVRDPVQDIWLTCLTFRVRILQILS